MRMQPLRSGLFKEIALAFSLVILLFSFAVYQFIILPDADRLAETELNLTATDIHHTTVDFFDEAERQLFLLRDYAVQGFFSSDNALDYYRFAMPLLRRELIHLHFPGRPGRFARNHAVQGKQRLGYQINLPGSTTEPSPVDSLDPFRRICRRNNPAQRL